MGKKPIAYRTVIPILHQRRIQWIRAIFCDRECDSKLTESFSLSLLINWRVSEVWLESDLISALRRFQTCSTLVNCLDLPRSSWRGGFLVSRGGVYQDFGHRIASLLVIHFPEMNKHRFPLKMPAGIHGHPHGHRSSWTCCNTILENLNVNPVITHGCSTGSICPGDVVGIFINGDMGPL